MGGEPPPIFRSRYRSPSGVTTSGASATSRVLASSLATSSRVLICSANVFAQQRGSARAAQRLQLQLLCQDASSQLPASQPLAVRAGHPTRPQTTCLLRQHTKGEESHPGQPACQAKPPRQLARDPVGCRQVGTGWCAKGGGHEEREDCGIWLDKRRTAGNLIRSAATIP